jgi:hypothetical protein
MDEEFVKNLIREYIAEHLNVYVEVNRWTSYDESPSVKVTISLDNEVISESSDTLPMPRINY